MASDADTDAPVDLYIAAYGDPDAARGDWDSIKQLAEDDAIKVDGLILVSRRTDGKIHVDDDFHEARKGAAWGAVGGAVIGLIFPPSLLAGAAVGAGLGAGAGGLISHAQKSAIKAESRTRCRPTAPASWRSSSRDVPTASTTRSRTPAPSRRKRSPGTARNRSRTRPRPCNSRPTGRRHDD